MTRLVIFLFILFYPGIDTIAQSSQADLERGLQEMERRGELRRNGMQIIFLKQRPADTALMRQVYQKMFEKIDNPYQIGFEVDPKYLVGKKNLPGKIKTIEQGNAMVHVPGPGPTVANGISLPEGRYMIKLNNGRVLEAESGSYNTDGARVQIWLPYYALNQLWDLKSAGAGKYYLVNVASGKALKVNLTAGMRNGSPVQLWPQESSSEETKWIIQLAGNQKYTIRSAAAGTNNKVLDVAGAVIDRGGSPIQLWDNLNGVNQTWSFTRSYDSAAVSANLVDLSLNQSPFKHQAPSFERGLCTYFGSIAVLEAAYKKRGYGELDLSEEYFSIMAKVMYLEPYWDRVTTSNFRENQFATTQGGGSVFWFTSGLKIPTEADVAFRPSLPVPPNYASTDQREANNYNTTQLTRNVLKASRYYGAVKAERFTDAQLRDPAEYEKILNLGYEINVDINGGGHNLVIIGYDKTDAANPKFLIKDSYNITGTRWASNPDRRLYNTIIASPIVNASYITEISEPAPFPELAFMGRWNLDFDGHKGLLDIYHIPGINYTYIGFGGAMRVSNGGTIIPVDNRIGVFYDESGNAFRVNGKIVGNAIEFYFDLSTPNQRWDELRGRKFTYFLDTTLDIMSGFHMDSDGTKSGGYATKGPYISHNTAEPFLDRFINTEWNLQWGNHSGIIRGRVSEDGSLINGSFNDGRTSRPITLSYDAVDRSMINIRMGESRAKVKFLNHEKGMLCGNSTDQQIVLLYKQ